MNQVEPEVIETTILRGHLYVKEDDKCVETIIWKKKAKKGEIFEKIKDMY